MEELHTIDTHVTDDKGHKFSLTDDHTSKNGFDITSVPNVRLKKHAENQGINFSTKTSSHPSMDELMQFVKKTGENIQKKIHPDICIQKEGGASKSLNFFSTSKESMSSQSYSNKHQNLPHANDFVGEFSPNDDTPPMKSLLFAKPMETCSKEQANNIDIKFDAQGSVVLNKSDTKVRVTNTINHNTLLTKYKKEGKLTEKTTECLDRVKEVAKKYSVVMHRKEDENFEDFHIRVGKKVEELYDKVRQNFESRISEIETLNDSHTTDIGMIQTRKDFEDTMCFFTPRFFSNRISAEPYANKFYYVSMCDPYRISFTFNDSTEEEAFWRMYQDNIYDSVNTNIPMGIGEVVNPDKLSDEKYFMPLLVDVDIKINLDNEDKMDKYTEISIDGRHLYDKEHVQNLIRYYQDAILEYTINIKNDNLICMLLEKPSYICSTEDGKRETFKSGFHLHFPKVFMSLPHIRDYIIPNVQKRVRENKLFDDLPNDVVGKDSLIDTAVTTNPWLLYGSRKKSNYKPYTYSRLYDHELNVINLVKGMGDMRIAVSNEFIINPRTYDFPKCKSRDISQEDRIRYFLPRLLSTHAFSGFDTRKKYFRQPSLKIQNLIESEKLRKEMEKREKKQKYEGYEEWDTRDDSHVEKDLEETSCLLLRLAPEHYTDYKSWNKIGFYLYQISKGSENGLDLWREFSEQRAGGEHGCDKHWDGFRKSNINMAFSGLTKIRELVSENKEFGKIIDKTENKNEDDSREPDMFEKFIYRFIETDELIGDADGGDFLHEVYGDQVVYTNLKLKQGSVYRFKNNKWTNVNTDIEPQRVFTRLRNMITNKILPDAEKTLNRELQDNENSNKNKGKGSKFSDASEKNIRADYVEKRKKLQNLKKVFASSLYMNRATQCSMEHFLDVEFEDKLDTDSMLIGFKNGVYDLRMNEFREGSPDDHISKTMNVEYREFNRNDIGMKFVRKFFKQLFPNASVREYFLSVLSTIFEGGNYQKIIQFWTGVGHNGKTIMQHFLEQIFGPYAGKAPTELITGKKPEAHGANAVMARLGGGVRWLVLDEPNKTEQVNGGTMKQLTGNDSLYARDLYQAGKTVKEITPMFKVAVICNTLPKFNDPDKAALDRVRVIPFEARFLNDEDYREEITRILQMKIPNEEKKEKIDMLFRADNQIDIKLKAYAEQLAFTLLEHRKRIGRQFVIPEKVKFATEQYKKTNFLISEFLENEVIKVEPTRRMQLRLSDIEIAFKDFCNSKSNRPPTMEELHKYIKVSWGIPDNETLTGATLFKNRRLRDDNDAKCFDMDGGMDGNSPHSNRCDELTLDAILRRKETDSDDENEDRNDSDFIL
jgi:P4 family phage/plasmid primase-like protien